MHRLILLIVFFLLILSLRFIAFYDNQIDYKTGQQVSLETTLLEDTEGFGSHQRIIARLKNGERVFISTTAYPKYTYGQTLQIKGKLQIKDVERGQIYSMSYPEIIVLPTTNLIVGLISPVRSYIVTFFQKSLASPGSNLMLGIVFGIKSAMPKDFDQLLQNAGVLHVIAASGMNVTIVGGFLATIFGSFLKRQYALLATIGGIIFYAGLAGFAPSIVRASIMGILVFSAQILGRQTLALYGLFLAAFIMLIYQPFLLFDVGFQLSFMACWGLIVFSPLAKLVEKKKGIFWVVIVKSDFFTTLIASFSTLPILLATFGMYSPVSLVVNLLVLWTIPLLMVIGGVGMMIGFIVPVVGQWILYLALPLLSYFISVVEFFGGFQAVTLEMSWQMVVGYYLLLLAVVLALKRKV